mmetsp:Transcript_6797/g.12603  ORF Transcript_6797/g.12603 Transcript_6797/m.12603 type:complete len:263 (-) Transcript_6797:74-862(-)
MAWNRRSVTPPSGYRHDWARFPTPTSPGYRQEYRGPASSAYRHDFGRSQTPTPASAHRQASLSRTPGQRSSAYDMALASGGVPQQPFHQVIYNRSEPRPAPLTSAPSLVAASVGEGERNQEMIYVQCEIADSGMSTEMLVDTGAQISVISVPLVREFGLMPYLDRSNQGIASGVGNARIVGHLRGVPVRLGTYEGVEFALDFAVLAVDDDLLMLGIDQLRRFGCIIDLQKQRLMFGGYDGSEVSFVPAPPKRLSWRLLCPTM